MRLPSLIIAGMLAFLSLPAQAETIEFPEDDFWRALTQSLAGDGPDFEALAKRTPEYRAADEFSRDAVLAEQVARLEARHSRVGPETEVLIRASVRLGDYDAARGGFPVSLFAPGTYLRVGGGLRFSNGSDYAILPATPEEGRAIREREASSSLNSAILRASDFRRDPGHANGLLATLYQFDYVDGDGGIITSMAHARQTPALDDAAVEALVQKTQADILAAASLPPIGSDWSSVRDALTAGYGFAVSDSGAYDDGRFRMVGGRIEEDDLDEAAQFRVGFGNDGDMVAGIFANQDFMARARLPLGEIDTNPTGRGLDCGTPHLADACGVLIFDRIEGEWKLTRAEGVVDLPGQIMSPPSRRCSATMSMPFYARMSRLPIIRNGCGAIRAGSISRPDTRSQHAIFSARTWEDRRNMSARPIPGRAAPSTMRSRFMPSMAPRTVRR
ncbi:MULTISPECIES: hypothetical protein [unclassified Martelella]|uniref:hypothetical protein n=1 Tax=unclassified Martelella TaxID=2629616 RepID=UPI0025C0085C|nr:hypothetical protein [Martelella sp.]